MKKLFCTLVILGSLGLQGCSAIMALNGDKEPNFSVVTKGQSKAVVEAQPLKPFSLETLENGNIVATYHYTVGNEPSTGRAVVYVLLDCLTFFISEIVTMPIEMSRKGEIKVIKIEYTPSGEVVKVG